MGLEVPKGIRSTGDLLAKPLVRRPPRKKKMPPLSKKERSNRKQQIKVRLKEINNERLKHDADLAKMTPERARLLSNLESEKARQQGKINSLMEEHFASATPGKLVDRILQSEMIEPRLQQLRGNIDKLDHSIAWHRSKLAALSKEEHELNKEADDLTAYDLLAECHAAYEAWTVVYLDAEMRFEKFKDSIIEARQYDRNFLNRLPALGIKDESFVTITDSKLKDEYISEVSQDAVVRDMALDYRTQGNKFYQDPNISVSRRLKPQEPLRRESFDTGHKLGKTA